MMTSMTARVPTAHASLYLQKLCKHWSHKLQVSFTPKAGHVPFGEGRALDLTADAEGLSLTVNAANAETAQRFTSVVFDHLKRMAITIRWNSRCGRRSQPDGASRNKQRALLVVRVRD
jgi:hypothetical protein